MSLILKNYLLVVFLSSLFALVSINWIFTGSPVHSFLAKTIEHRSKNIDRVVVDFEQKVTTCIYDICTHEKKIGLNVHLTNPISCDAIITELGVNTILVGDSTYKPTCTVIKPKYIQIVYIEPGETTSYP